MRRFFVIVSAVTLAVFLACGAVNDSSDATGPGDNGNRGAGFDNLYSSYLNKCANCHAPNAMGRTPDTEKSLDFSTADTAFASLKGAAAGLQGNVLACNGVAFIGATYETSLLAAVLDENVRANFKSGQCDQDAVTSMTNKLKVDPPAGFLDALKSWIDSGAPR